MKTVGIFLEAENQNGFFPSYITGGRDTESAQQSPREVFSSIVIADTLREQTLHEELRRAALQYIDALQNARYILQSLRESEVCK